MVEGKDRGGHAAGRPLERGLSEGGPHRKARAGRGDDHTVRGEIGEEVHPDTDQVLVFVDGSGAADLDGQTGEIGPNDLVFVHGGTRHNFRNTGEGPLRLITISAPPEHAPGTVHLTKAEADAAEG